MNGSPTFSQSKHDGSMEESSSMSIFFEDGTPYISPPGEAYSVVDLQQRLFHGKSPRESYLILCKKAGCRVISAVANMLSELVGNWDQCWQLDLSRTYVGPRGVVPVLELTKLLPNLRSLSLSENYLNSQAVWHVCKAALHHPCMQFLDLSKNDITWTGGMCVLELVVKNPNIRRVELHGTMIKPNVIRTIEAQIHTNCTAGVHQRRQMLSLTNNPRTVKLRALKRFFRELQIRHSTAASTAGVENCPFPSQHQLKSPTGTIPSSFLADGYKEMLRLSGRQVEIHDHSHEFFEKMCTRAPEPEVDWETFMLLVMIEEAQYDAALVAHLKDVFNHYDTSGQGYVELSNLGAMMARARHAAVSPSQAEIDSLMSFFGADESMTATWDEFLLMMYDRGPEVGCSASFQTATPMTTSRSIHH